MTDLTKRALADALKRLLQKRSLTHITIQNVADEANVSRKTFYYHFHDIFDLVEWMLIEESKRITAGRQGSVTWMQDVADALSYTAEDRGWMCSIYASMDRDRLERILRKIIGPLVEAAFNAAVAGRPVGEEDRRFVLEIFTYGITGLFTGWVGDGMPADASFLGERLSGFFGDSLQMIADRCVKEATDQDKKRLN